VNENKWRVMKIGRGAWCVWPPGWRAIESPLLAFRTWHAAFQAAFDRAQFVHSPAPRG